MKIIDEQQFDYSHPRFLIGDEGLQCQKTCLSPVKSRNNRVLTQAEKLFNKTLTSFRVKNEHAFGHLKNTFPILKQELRKDTPDNSTASDELVNPIGFFWVIWRLFLGFRPERF